MFPFSALSGLNIIILSQDRLSGRTNVASDKVNFRPDIIQYLIEESGHQEHQEFMWLLKQLGFVAP